MVSSRSSACSKLGSPSAAGPADAGLAAILFAGMVLPRSNRLDARVRFAARELNRDRISRRQIGGNSQQSTVRPPHKAITAFHDPARRERAQPVLIASETQASRLHPLD